jgi:hypothetical protein
VTSGANLAFLASRTKEIFSLLALLGFKTLLLDAIRMHELSTRTAFKHHIFSYWLELIPLKLYPVFGCHQVAFGVLISATKVAVLESQLRDVVDVNLTREEVVEWKKLFVFS